MLNHDRVMQMVKKKIINNTKSNWYSLKFNFYWFRCWCYPRFEVFFDNEVEYLKLYAIKYIIGHKCMYPWKYQFNSSPRNVLLSQFFVRSSCVHLRSPLRLRSPLTKGSPCVYRLFSVRSLIVQFVFIHFYIRNSLIKGSVFASHRKKVKEPVRKGWRKLSLDTKLF